MPSSPHIPYSGALCAFLQVAFLLDYPKIIGSVAPAPRERPNVVDVVLFRVELFAFQISRYDRPSRRLRHVSGAFLPLPSSKQNERRESGDELFLRRLEMRLKTHCGEDHDQSTEGENSLCQIPQKEPCAFSCESQCSEPVEAHNRPDNKDNPVDVGIARDVKRRLHQRHQQRRKLFGFPGVRLYLGSALLRVLGNRLFLGSLLRGVAENEGTDER